MRSLKVSVHACLLDQGRDVVREPHRPGELRHADFEDGFDFTTLFYDCFWEADGRHAFLIGPPPLNLRDELGIHFRAYPSNKLLIPQYLGGVPLERIRLDCPTGSTAILIDVGTSEFLAPIQPNLSSLMHDRRVVTTMNKNNDLQWVRDWAEFNRQVHGCDAVILYENSSTRYGIGDLLDCLDLGDGFLGVVVDWPFRYGVPDWRLPVSYNVADSLFSQPATLEHARRRMLASARSVLNTDIDELVCSNSGRTVFEVAENSATGLVHFGGLWVSTHPFDSDAIVAHSNFGYVELAGATGNEPKWAADPRRIPDAAQWHVHRIVGMAPDPPDSEIEFRHFRAINTNWTVDKVRSSRPRTSAEEIPLEQLVADLPLHQAISRVNFTRVSMRPTTKVQDAYSLRAKAASALERGDAVAASALASRAAALAPEIASLQDYAAKTASTPGIAASFAHSARSVRDASALIEMQSGRWNDDDGDLVAAEKAYRTAISLDPSLVHPYVNLARLCEESGRPAEADRTLRECVANASDPVIALILLAKRRLWQQRSEKAEKLARRACALWPERPITHSTLARVLREKNDIAGAERAVSEGLAAASLELQMQIVQGDATRVYFWLDFEWIWPVVPEIHLEAALTYSAAGRLDDARRHARAALTDVHGKFEPGGTVEYYLVTADLQEPEQRQQTIAAAEALMHHELARPRPFHWAERSWGNYRGYCARQLAELLTRQGMLTQAIAMLEHWSRLLPDDFWLLADLFRRCLEMPGERTPLVERIRDATKKWQDVAMFHRLLERAMPSGDTDARIASLRMAISAEPQGLEDRRTLARLLFDCGRYAEAERIMQEVFDMEQNDPEMLFLLSRIEMSMGRISRARDAGRKSLSAGKPSPWYWDHYLSVLIAAGDWTEAEREAASAIAAFSHHPTLHYRQSLIKSATGDLESAILSARRSVVMSHEPFLHAHLAEMLSRRGETSEARNLLEVALKQSPENPQLHYQLATLLQRSGDIEIALMHSRMAADASPVLPHAVALHAALLNELGRHVEAENAALKAASSKHGGVHFQLSRALTARGAYRLAVKHARIAARLDQAQPAVRAHLESLLRRAKAHRSAPIQK